MRGQNVIEYKRPEGCNLQAALTTSNLLRGSTVAISHSNSVVSAVKFKICRKCGQSLSSDCFTSDKSKKDGLRTICKSCDQVSRKIQYKKNQKKVCKQQKQYRKLNASKVKESKKAYAQANRDKIQVYQQQWRAEHQEEMKAYGRSYYRANKGRWKRCKDNRLRYSKTGRHLHLKKKFGMTQFDYEVLLSKQNFGCAICGTQDPGKGKKHFHIDHNHQTGTIRGLLCVRCNMGLGCFCDNQTLLKTASDYLLKD